MNKIEIDEQFDVFIVEKAEGDKIPKGAFIYCGVCGNPIGELKDDITFPFRSDALQKKMKGWSLEHMPLWCST